MKLDKIKHYYDKERDKDKDFWNKGDAELGLLLLPWRHAYPQSVEEMGEQTPVY